MRKLIYQLGFVGVVATLAAGCCTYQKEEVNVPWTAVPAIVQSTITAHQYGGTVGKIEKETMKGNVVYEAKIKGPEGQSSEIKVAEDGKLIKYKGCDNNCKD